jgi:probable HAF family extracellular repeat protein
MKRNIPKLYPLGMALAFLLMVGCKIEITVPQGGRVTTLYGNLHCDEGRICTIDDNDGYFREFFLAVPAPGYVFAKWKKRKRSLCGNKSKRCSLDSTLYSHIPIVRQFLNSDELFYLEPVFIQRPRLATFTRLGDIPGGTFQSSGIGLSADGSTAVGSSRSGDSHPSEIQAFRWTEVEGMVALGDLPGPSIESHATDASLNGAVVVGCGTTSEAVEHASSAFEAFYWTAADGLTGIGDLPGAHFESCAKSVSNNGRIIVGHGVATEGRQAFRWTAEEGMVGLGDLPKGRFWSAASAISGNSKVIVGSGDSSSGEGAFRWTEDEGMVGLGDLPGGRKRSSARAVSHNGSVVVGSSEIRFTESTSWAKSEAFRWTEEEGMMGLIGKLSVSSSSSGATGVSANGAVIVGNYDEGAFIWTEDHGARPLKDVLIAQGATELLEWQLSVSGISADGRTVVGTGGGPNGSEAWVATFDPNFPAW